MKNVSIQNQTFSRPDEKHLKNCKKRERKAECQWKNKHPIEHFDDCEKKSMQKMHPPHLLEHKDKCVEKCKTAYYDDDWRCWKRGRSCQE